MATTIESSIRTSYVQPAQVPQQPVKASGDADGDNDGTKVGAVEAPKATATLGNKVNTFA